MARRLGGMAAVVRGRRFRRVDRCGDPGSLAGFSGTGVGGRLGGGRGGLPAGKTRASGGARGTPTRVGGPGGDRLGRSWPAGALPDRVSLPLTGAAWVGHAVFDRVHEHGEASSLPRWYPALCAGYDLGMAAMLCRTALDRSMPRR